ncbi:MAG: hypothetical protein ACRCUT_08310 [Spirochaetota bacterium]
MMSRTCDWWCGEMFGSGEASHADLGIAGARSGMFLLFVKGEKKGKIAAQDIVPSVSSSLCALLKR